MIQEGTSAAAALLRGIWASGVPATLQDAEFKLVQVNEAFEALVGQSQAQLVGHDLLELQPAEDREGNRRQRTEIAATHRSDSPALTLRRRLVDASGRQRWLTFNVMNLAEDGQPQRWLALMHDLSTEHAARQHAQRAEDELVQWFELSGSGMLVYDHTGLIVRSNAAFEMLVERVPEVLADAAPELQLLLAWESGAMSRQLTPGALPIERQVMLPMVDGRRRRLWARLACHVNDAGERRVMAVVQDRSAEDERDLAQLEMGMLMDTASVGVATYDPARGWLAPPRGARLRGDAKPLRTASAGALLGIGRELVEADSLPEFERLQRALRHGERAEVRYAVRHPELGARWLLTKVEPGALAGGRATTSVVTLDITEQESARRRNEQLLRELSTILDSSTAGIAYLRGPVLVRCNRPFERMLGFEAGAAAGATLEEIFGRSIDPPPALREVGQALAQGKSFEAELPLAIGGGPLQWYSLSVRRAEPEAEQPEAVAVLTDITRLKTQQTELEQLLRDRELMFSLSEVGIVYQRGARIERANQAMATLTGWAPPELTTLDAAELYENTRECVAFEARILSALRENGRFSGERVLRRRDGRLVWVQVAVRPVAVGDPEAGVICSFVDIDERRRARESMARQAERTRAILNSVLVGIVTVSERGIEWMNRSARRMFAGELADFVGEPISIVATPEPDHPLRRVDWLDRLKEGQAETFECRLRGRDGRMFWVVGNAVLTGQTTAGARASPSGGRELTFALLDIERRRQAEVSIAQAQASLQRVIETAPLAIALFDARTLRVQQVNQTASAFFGQPLDGVLGALPEDCCGPAQAAQLRTWLNAAAAAVAGSAVQQHEWRDQTAQAAVDQPDQADQPDAPRVWDCRITSLHEGDGGATQLLLVASDVTEQRAAERARLQAAIAQREVLVREVHHRIKNNLQGVAGLLQQNAVRHPEVAHVLSEAVGQVQAIAQVYGLQVGVSGPLSVASLLRAIAQSVQRTFGRPISVEVEGEVPHLLPEAESIPIALTVNELLTNAIKHGQGGSVRCTLQAEGDAVRVVIAGQATLTPGFDLAQVRGGVSGLGLVRALLPRRSATLSLQQEGDDVVATIELRPPSVRREPVADRPQSAP